MPFVPRSTTRRPRPVGRPPGAIPQQLRDTLDETVRTSTAWTEEITSTSDADLRELIRLGTRYSERLKVSFRHRITEDDEGRRFIAFWLCPKQKYQRKAS